MEEFADENRRHARVAVTSNVPQMRVTLRPVAREDFQLFERELYAPEALEPYQWFGFRSPTAALADFEESGWLSAEGGRLAVTAEGQLAGRVQWRVARWGPTDSPACWELGAVIFRDKRGAGIGKAAQRLLVDYLFRATNVNRVQAYTDVENAVEQRILSQIGFVEEGRIRQAQWRDGRWRDQLLFSILRQEWSSRSQA